MGIKNFYHGFRKKFENCITTSTEIKHDVLIIELNGLFYSSCKRLFHFYEMTSSYENRKRSNKINIKLFEEICNQLLKIIKTYPPKKKILLVVDGVAGMMKNMEQRQRRYKNSLENKYDFFDLNSFSPGSKLLNHLTKYIDWFIRCLFTTDDDFADIQIFFSNEKVVGEGELKINKFLRSHCTIEEEILIYNCDSDLILLSIINPLNITILRKSILYGEEYINIKKCKQSLCNLLLWDTEESNRFYMDIIVLFFFLGNDYSPGIPSCVKFDLLYEKIFPEYKAFGKYLTNYDDTQKEISICYAHFIAFCQKISIYEEEWILKKYSDENTHFQDPIVLDYLISKGGSFKLFKEKYYEKNFTDTETDKVVSYYCYNLENILNMFQFQKMNWSIYYPFFHAPFFSDFKKPPLFSSKLFSDIYLKDCFFNMLIVLPPQSKNLLPFCLQSIFTELKQFFPWIIEIDLTGKRKIWEGTIKLPFVDLQIFLNFYEQNKDKISLKEIKRNTSGKTFKYCFSHVDQKEFSSYYGKIENCPVHCILVDV